MSIPLLFAINERARELYRDPGDAGYDLAYAGYVDNVLMPGETKLIPTGVSTRIPHAHVGMVCSRSGLAANYSVHVLNSPGIVDSSYRGEIKVILRNASGSPYVIHPGDRIAQLVVIELGRVVPVRVAEDELGDPTKRGARGFGSTGR